MTQPDFTRVHIKLSLFNTLYKNSIVKTASKGYKIRRARLGNFSLPAMRPLRDKQSNGNMIPL